MRYTMNSTNKYFDEVFKKAVERTLDMRSSEGKIHYRDVLIMLAHYSSDHQKIVDKAILKHVNDALLDLEVAVDIDGNPMHESDAYDRLKKIVPHRPFNNF